MRSKQIEILLEFKDDEIKSLKADNEEYQEKFRRLDLMLGRKQDEVKRLKAENDRVYEEIEGWFEMLDSGRKIDVSRVTVLIHMELNK